MTSRDPLAHIVNWDMEFNRPIVGGNIAHPVTGEIQKAGPQVTSGPPGIEVILHNMNANVQFRTLVSNLPVSVDKLYVEVAKHVHDGIYRLRSVNASAYSFVIVCDILVSVEEFEAVWHGKFAKKVAVNYEGSI